MSSLVPTFCRAQEHSILHSFIHSFTLSLNSVCINSAPIVDTKVTIIVAVIKQLTERGRERGKQKEEGKNRLGAIPKKINNALIMSSIKYDRSTWVLEIS